MDSLTEKQYALEDLMPLIREALAAGKSVKFAPRGTSMLPMLRQGIDSVTLSPLPQKLRKYDLPLYQRENGQYVLHRIVRAGENYTCMGDNQFVKESGLRRDQMIAVVTAFYRDGKRYHVDALGHQLYCRFWHYSRPVRRIWRGGWNWLRRHLK
ncbi:MAG: S24/S26 family peptidase [Oscillospiraceae bacterium]|nr:S24/S26 family peptidase [Oscillospiraceae bacterium]